MEKEAKRKKKKAGERKQKKLKSGVLVISSVEKEAEGRESKEGKKAKGGRIY